MGLFRKNKQVKNEIMNENIKYYSLSSNGKYEIEINEEFISINAKGIMNTLNKGITGVKKIDMNNITAVQYKPPGMTTGYIQFVLLGSQEVKSGVMGAVKDENTILFTKKDEEIVLEIKNHIENFISKKNKGQQNSSAVLSIADEILKFKELLDIGVITQDEFDNKKKSLLNL